MVTYIIFFIETNTKKWKNIVVGKSTQCSSNNIYQRSFFQLISHKLVDFITIIFFFIFENCVFGFFVDKFALIYGKIIIEPTQKRTYVIHCKLKFSSKTSKDGSLICRNCEIIICHLGFVRHKCSDSIMRLQNNGSGL